MSCPHSSSIHSSPLNCSQCLGVIPRRVRIVNTVVHIITDDITGSVGSVGVSLTQSKTRITIDGVESDRITDVRRTLRNTRAYRKKSERRCSLCGKLAHARQQCGQVNQ